MADWKIFRKDKKAFTGLEAAIVLTAFVVVASVFSYMVLSAGFFTSEKSKQVIHTGMDTATSSIQLAGDVIGHGWNYSKVEGNSSKSTYGKWTTNPNVTVKTYYAWKNSSVDDRHQLNTSKLNVVQFEISLTSGQRAIDMDKLGISYNSEDEYVSNITRTTNNHNESKGNFTNITWSSDEHGRWTYELIGTERGGSNMLDPGEKMLITIALPYQGVGAYGVINLELKPAEGSVLPITVTAPGSIEKTMVLH